MAVTNVLIVEDEPLIAMMIEDFLDILGKRHAGTADNVREALAMVARGGIDAAILDLNLRGGETSWPVAEQLAERGVPFIFASGGLGEKVEPPFDSRPVLPKPFTIDAVAKALDALG